MKKLLLIAAIFLSLGLAVAPLFANGTDTNTLKGLLDGVKDPNIAYLLFVIGLYGIIFEIATPGVSIGGIIGVGSLALAFYGMNALPVNYTGLILMILSFVLFILDVIAPMVISTTGLMVFVLPLIVKAQKRRASSGLESLVDAVGETKTDLAPKGMVHIKGEDWYAESLEGTIKAGEKVKV